MNNCVSDDYVIINIQGIRNVTWGESHTRGYSSEPGKPFYITVTYKGSHNIFYYKTENEANHIFNLIRIAMDKSFVKVKE